MDQHKEELATIESIDSGAVYTLALKTHVGMSIDTWRYFAGWCDKIQGKTIPINNARPNRNLTITKREPIGSVGRQGGIERASRKGGRGNGCGNGRACRISYMFSVICPLASISDINDVRFRPFSYSLSTPTRLMLPLLNWWCSF